MYLCFFLLQLMTIVQNNVTYYTLVDIDTSYFRFARFIHCACNFYIDDNMRMYATLIGNFNCCSLCAHKPRGWASGLGQLEKKCGKARTLVSFSPGKERAHCHTYVLHHNVVSTRTATRTTIVPHYTLGKDHVPNVRFLGSLQSTSSTGQPLTTLHW